MKHPGVEILLIVGLMKSSAPHDRYEPNWGYLALIVDAETDEQLCAGTFLSPYIVMTPGRCLTERTLAVRTWTSRDDAVRQSDPVVTEIAKRFRHYKYDFYVNDIGFAVLPKPIVSDWKNEIVTVPLNEYQYEKWVSDVVFEERICHVPILKVVDSNGDSSPEMTFTDRSPVRQTKPRRTIEMMSVKLMKYGDCVTRLVNDLNLTNSEINIEILLGVGLVCGKPFNESVTMCNVRYGSPIMCDNQNKNQLLGVMSMDPCSKSANKSGGIGVFTRSDRVVKDFVRVRKLYDLNASFAVEEDRFVNVVVILFYTYQVGIFLIPQ